MKIHSQLNSKEEVKIILPPIRVRRVFCRIDASYKKALKFGKSIIIKLETNRKDFTMLSKIQVANLMEIVAVGSMTAIGFAIGNPIATEVIKGIGLNLASDILQRGSSKLKETWFSTEYGILNHDIQKAFVRAFVESSDYLEKQYFQSVEDEFLDKNQKGEVKDLFRQMREQAAEVFLEDNASAISEDDLKICLYKDEKSGQEIVWQKIRPIVSTFDSHLQNFLRKNLLKIVVFFFAEELKKETQEGVRAWRAFQRLLLEGIKAEVETIGASQELIQADLKKLDFIARDVKLMSYVLQYRLIEPLGADLKIIKEGVFEIREKVEKIHGLVEKINSPPVFDENQFRREYNEALHRVMFANSAYELNSVKHQLEYMEKKYPDHPDIFFLKDKFNRAQIYETKNHPSFYPGATQYGTTSPPVSQNKASLPVSSKAPILSPRNIRLITASFILLFGITLIPAVVLFLFPPFLSSSPDNPGGISPVFLIVGILFLISAALFGIWLIFLAVRFFRAKLSRSSEYTRRRDN